MSFLPDEEIMEKKGLNLAPMIDFLFLMLAFFASLAVSRVATKDLGIDLVKIEEETNQTLAQSNTEQKVIHINISPEGEYTWTTDINDYQMKSPDEIAQELESQYQKGLLPKEREQTQVLLKIDRKAPWEPIAHLIFSVRKSGFEIKPIYEVEEPTGSSDYLVEDSSFTPSKNPLR